MKPTKELIDIAYHKALNQDIREQDNKIITSFAEALFEEFKKLNIPAVTLKCDLCDYVGTEINPVGECPKCNWDELQPIKLPLTIIQEYIDEICGDPEKAQYTLFPDTFHTVCCIKLPNGATVIGESVCAASKIYNEKLGREYAFKQAKEKVWQFEGYALCEKRFQAGLKK